VALAHERLAHEHAVDPEVAHRAAVAVAVEDDEPRDLPTREPRERLARAPAPRLALLRGVDLGEPHAHACLSRPKRERVAVVHGDDRADERDRRLDRRLGGRAARRGAGA